MMLLFWIFCDILSLNVKMHLWLKLYTVPFFVSGQTYTISKGSNNYCSHCIYIYSGVPGHPVGCRASTGWCQRAGASLRQSRRAEEERANRPAATEEKATSVPRPAVEPACFPAGSAPVQENLRRGPVKHKQAGDLQQKGRVSVLC